MHMVFFTILSIKVTHLCVFPLVQFRVDVPDERRDVMVLAECQHFNFNTQFVPPPPTIDDGSTPLHESITQNQH